MQDRGVHLRVKFVAVHGNADDDGCNRFRYRLHGVRIGSLIIRMVLGIEVVVDPGQTCIQRPRGARFLVVNLLVIVRVRALVHILPGTDDEHAVDVGILAAHKIGVQ